MNTAPTAEAGGPYQVNEGSTVQLNGTGSTDPHNAILTYTWSPGANLDDPSSATPVYSAIDDTVDNSRSRSATSAAMSRRPPRSPMTTTLP